MIKGSENCSVHLLSFKIKLCGSGKFYPLLLAGNESENATCSLLLINVFWFICFCLITYLLSVV